MSTISVILPFKNAEDTLRAAVNSILKQSLSDFELLLIDDNSHDDSSEVAASIDDQRIKLIKNPGSGLASALNFGIKQAKGEYIARMDSDDISQPNRFKEQLRYALDHPFIDVISCLVEHRSGKPSEEDIRGYGLHVEWLNKLISPEEHFANRFVDATIAHPTLFCRKDLFEKCGYYSESALPEDFELWLRWMDQGVKFAKVDESLFQWLDYSDRLSRTHTNYDTQKFFRLKAQYFAKWWQGQGKGNLWIWGYGKDVFRRTSYLEEQAIHLNGFIDIVERSGTNRLVLPIDKVQKSNDDFYLVYVSNRQGKSRIRSYFDDKGMQPNEDYLFMT